MERTEKKQKTISDLEQCYREAETCDSEIFADMRSNLLLVSGEHYNKSQSSFFRRIRDSKQLNDQQKVRLVKNHIQRITKTYANNIISACPGVFFGPKNENELQDQKAAELHQAVWQDARERYDLDEKVDQWCDSFIQIGEVAVKVFWDPEAGEIRNFEQAVDEDGNPLFEDQQGNQYRDPFDPMTGEQFQPSAGKPVYKGQFVFEEVYGFNLLRAPEAKTLEESPYLIVRKMMNKDLLIAKYPAMKSKITESADQTMVVFDPAKGGYHKAQNQVMVKEHFYRPCHEYPRGYFYIVTKEVELESGELPGGIFPIEVEQFERIQTTPRGRSPIKQMRPYQAEINRAASKIAEHQITLGDDKIITVNGSKLTQGAAFPGVRALNATGQAPIVLQGRNGAQYLDYLNAQIAELYDVMMVAESKEDAGQQDPYAMLFSAASRKKKFSRYIRRFERFLVKVAKLHNKLAKFHLPDDMVIYAVGRKEQVNIAEFRAATDFHHQVKAESQSDDIETKFGKQLVLNHLVQYTGANLSKEDIGKLVRLMPYANMEEGLSDLTIDFDSATNDILALDRGEVPAVQKYDDHVYCIRRAVSRTRQPDFKFLDPAIQQNYDAYIEGHQQAEAERQKALQMAEQGFIPTGGYLVTVDFYVADPEDSAKTRRARLPYEAIRWLIEKLETQGQSQEELETMNQGAVAEMAQMFMRKAQGQPQGMRTPEPVTT